MIILLGIRHAKTHGYDIEKGRLRQLHPARLEVPGHIKFQLPDAGGEPRALEQNAITASVVIGRRLDDWQTHRASDGRQLNRHAGSRRPADQIQYVRRQATHTHPRGVLITITGAIVHT